ncbi:MAG: oligosaccharide flippase family protein [Brevinematia bacterium]
MDFLKKIFLRREFFDSSLVSFSNFFVGGINFIFHIAMQRMLGPEKYGIVYPLIILSMFISLIPSTFQFVITREASLILHGKEKQLVYGYIKSCFFYLSLSALALIFIFFVSLPLLKRLMHITTDMDFYYLIIMTTFPFFINTFVSFVQAREKFFFYSILQIVPTLIKLLSGILIVYYTKDYIGVLASFIIANVFTIIILLLEFSRSNKKPIRKDIDYKFDVRKFFISFLKTFPAISGFIILSNIDSIIVRFSLPELSGIYSSVSVIGKAPFYIALSVSTVFLPILSKTDDLKRANRLAVLFLSIFLAGFVLVLFLFSPFISAYILKGQYYGFENLLPYYSTIFIPYAYITYFVNYYVIKNKRIYDISIFLAIIIQIILIVFFCKNLVDVANVVGLTGIFVLVVLLFEARISHFLASRKKWNN